MKSLVHDKPIKAILLFAIPLYIGQLFSLCYGLIDIRIIGRFLGDASLAAVGATTALSDLLMEFEGGIVCGFGIIIAKQFGANNNSRMKRAIGGTVFLSITLTIFISAICLIFMPYILSFLNISEELRPEAASYITIVVAGMIASVLYTICATILRAIGDSFTPLIFLIISNILNIFLDIFLVVNLNMGVTGAALATVLTQALSALLCFIYMRKKYPQIVLKLSDLKPKKDIYKELLPNGLSMGFMLSFVLLGSLALQTAINALGFDIIVAHTAARKATMIFLIPLFVLGSALATFCGQNLGAKEYRRIREGIKGTVLISSIWCIASLVIIFTLAPTLVNLITASTQPNVITNATLYLKVNSIFYILPAIICILRNSMQGFGDTKTPLVSSFIELAGKVIIAFLLVPAMRYMGVIVSEPIVWAVMVIPLLISIRRNPMLKSSKNADGLLLNNLNT